ncbi:MAG: RICIN domain-containing protein [Mycobacterium sp.]|nr:RICIN domain-containing protein [Mycobacterium sp.]
MTPKPNDPPDPSRRRLLTFAAAGAGVALVSALPGATGIAQAAAPRPRRHPHGRPTIGGGSIDQPARGPAPAFGPDNMTLVKNWDFGANGTIPDIATMNSEFLYHDQFGTISNGGNYGAVIVAPDAANAISGQPVQDPANPVRAFTADSLQTYLVPLDGATTVTPADHNCGCGSFMAQFTLPNGGALLGQNLLWETRLRYVTPPYFWLGLWTSGNIWIQGAEMDVIESFGYDNGGGATNYDGHNWHTDSVGGLDGVNFSDWTVGMAAAGITSFDATQYHTWQWYYNADDTFQVMVDGIVVQSGVIHWTVSGIESGQPINMYFLFDAAWGHNQVGSVDHSLDASQLVGKLYEYDYTRIYLSDAGTTTYYSVVNRNSGKVLGVGASSIADGASLDQWDNLSLPSQQWSLQDTGDGYTYVVNRNSGKVLGIADSSTDDGAAPNQWANLSEPSQQWQFQDTGDGYTYVVNRNSGKVLGIADSSTDDGAAANQWTNLSEFSQQWQLIPVGTGPSLAQNSSFETGNLSGWRNNGVVGVESSVVQSGSYAVQLNAANNGVDQIVTGLSANTTYVLSGWVNNTDGSDTTYIGVKDYGGPEADAIITGTGWQQGLLAFTTGSSNTSADIYIWKNAGSGATYGDDITLKLAE